MSFIASSNLWGDQACARLCEIIVDANDGMSQQIMENRHDLLDLLTAEQLRDTDDLGLTLPFLAVYYDRPDMLKYLRKRGFDLSQPCDPMNFGNTMFYAISLGKVDLISVLNSLGVSINDKCETFSNQVPLYYAKRADNIYLIETIKGLQDRERRAKLFLLKNVLKIKDRKRYHKVYRYIRRLQRFCRWILLCRSRIHVRRRKLSDASESLSFHSAASINSGSSQSESVSKGGDSKTSKKQSTNSGGKVAEDDRSRASNGSKTSKASVHTIKGLRSRASSSDSTTQQGTAPQKPPHATSTTTTNSKTRVATRPSFDDSDEENDARRERAAEGKQSVKKSYYEEEEIASVRSENASKDGQLHSAHSLNSSRSDDAT